MLHEHPIRIGNWGLWKKGLFKNVTFLEILENLDLISPYPYILGGEDPPPKFRGRPPKNIVTNGDSDTPPPKFCSGEWHHRTVHFLPETRFVPPQKHFLGQKGAAHPPPPYFWEFSRFVYFQFPEKTDHSYYSIRKMVHFPRKRGPLGHETIRHIMFLSCNIVAFRF